MQSSIWCSIPRWTVEFEAEKKYQGWTLDAWLIFSKNSTFCNVRNTCEIQPSCIKRPAHLERSSWWGLCIHFWHRNANRRATGHLVLVSRISDYIWLVQRCAIVGLVSVFIRYFESPREPLDIGFKIQIWTESCIRQMEKSRKAVILIEMLFSWGVAATFLQIPQFLWPV